MGRRARKFPLAGKLSLHGAIWRNAHCVGVHRGKTVIYRTQGEVVVMISGSGMYDEFGREYIHRSEQISTTSE
jgi:hypothetical protein